VALGALARGRSAGLDDAEMAVRDPVVLTLVPPSLVAVGSPRLPAAVPPSSAAADTADRGAGPTVDDLDLRDALRLRARWLQELNARLAGELVERLGAGDPELTPELGRELSFDELLAMAGGQRPVTVAELKARAARPSGPPLPTAFELDAAGTVHVAGRGHRAAPTAAGLPASAGRAVGVARHRLPAGEPQPDAILVTRFLEPRLAPLLPGLAGLVAETGSALSHLAILAREAHVPTVVGVEGALTRFPPGTRLVVDGSTGDIEVLP